MKIGKMLHVKNRAEWRKWLSENHRTEPEIWLVSYRKSTGKQNVSYDDAVLEALCFGWIDSILKKIDSDKFVQRYSPRKKKSNLSQMNIERIRQLIREKKMTKAGLNAVSGSFDPGRDSPDFVVPKDILNGIRSNRKAWHYFRKLPLSYKRIRIAYIESRKRHGTEMYKRALSNFIKATAQNKRIGFVKERK